MTANGTVSVIMACHNAALFVGQAITSFVEQSYSDTELIIVDDASSDESLRIAEDGARQDSRISICALKKNVGPARARNIAIEKSVGRWIANLDADDVFLKNKLERQIELAGCDNSDLVLVGTNSYEIDGNGSKLSTQKYPVGHRALSRALVQRRRFPPHSSLLYRADSLRRIGGFNVRFDRSQDYDLQLRLLAEGRLASIPEPLVKYRVHESNISMSDGVSRQLTYSMAAGTCHYLRESGFDDPSNSPVESKWLDFLRWIGERLRAHGYIEYKESKLRAKDELRAISTRPAQLLKFSRDLVRRRHFGHFLNERLFGTRMYSILALEWRNRNHSNPSTTE